MTNTELIEHFNKHYPVGATVRWRSIALDRVPHKEFTVRGEAFDHHGQAVCFLNEYSGMVSIDPKFVDYADNFFNEVL